MNLFKVIILKFLKSAFIRLSQADGKPGFSVDDLLAAVRRVVTIEETSEGNGQLKATDLADWIVARSGGRVAPWVAMLLGYVAYLYAKRKGEIP